MPIISLIGYTGSGKTTLFNLLTAEHKETSSSLFTTLSTTTRSFSINNDDNNDNNKNLLLIDTVGFISRLPHYMIDAFKSTLEESLAADFVLLLIDASEKIEDIRIKYASCCNVLEELEVDKSKVFVVLSKCDNNSTSSFQSEAKIQDIANDLKISNPIAISSKTGYGIHKLKAMIGNHHIKLTH